jgi:hypothetical protein
MRDIPAFPKTPFIELGTPQNGMTLRDYFAAKAMQAFINRDEWQSTVKEVSRETAFNAYAMADAMMKEREE